MKRLFSFLFSAILIITMMPQAIGASADSKIYWQDTTVMVEELFSVYIEAQNLDPAKSILIAVDYDESVLQLTDGEWLLSDPDIYDWSCETKDGAAAYLEEQSFDGQLLRLDFVAIDIARTDDFVIDIDCAIKNGNKVIEFEVVPGQITIQHTHTADEWEYKDAENHVSFCIWCEQIMHQYHSFDEMGYDEELRANKHTCRICHADEYYVRHGDIDRNGRIESSDARSILRFAVELDVPDETQYILSDVYADGRISSEDARLTLRASVDLEDKTQLPVMRVSVS